MKFSHALIKKILLARHSSSGTNGGRPKAPSAARLAAALNAHSFEVESVKGDTLEIKLPANLYSYAASHIGIAREAAAISGLPFRSPVKTVVNPPTGRGLVKVKIEDEKLCPRYGARVFDIPRVGQSSAEVKRILRNCGVNAVNSIVDLMNYAMLETGQPLHAFDFEKVKGGEVKSRKSKIKIENAEIVIRRARRGEKMETLDRKLVELTPGALVIANRERPLAVAGIKGGLYSGVTEKTRWIVVEAANFDAVSIYQTSRRLKLATDAGIRFSHGISPALVAWGMDRATELLGKLGAKLLDSVDAYPKPAGDEIVNFDLEKYERLVGEGVLLTDAKKIFEQLGFSVETKMKKGEGVLRVRIPAWRNDVENFEDLAEEVARLTGYNGLPKTPPVVSLRPAAQEDVIVLKDKIRAVLRELQMDEVYNYSFFKEAEMQTSPFGSLFGRDARPVELENPIAEDKKFLRMGLAPQLLKNVRDNARFFPEVRIFELGKVFAARGGKVEERLAAGFAVGGKNRPRAILELKGVVEELLNGLGLDEFHFKPEGELLRVESGDRVVGQLALTAQGKSWDVAVCELDAEYLLRAISERIEFKALPKYPAVVRDVSLLLPREARIGDLVEFMEENGPEILEDVNLVDECAADDAARQSLTFRLTFQSDKRTLLDEEVGRETEKLTEAVKKNFQAQVR